LELGQPECAAAQVTDNVIVTQRTHLALGMGKKVDFLQERVVKKSKIVDFEKKNIIFPGHCSQDFRSKIPSPALLSLGALKIMLNHHLDSLFHLRFFQTDRIYPKYTRIHRNNNEICNNRITCVAVRIKN
jgi:hypothetical protein